MRAHTASCVRTCASTRRAVSTYLWLYSHPVGLLPRMTTESPLSTEVCFPTPVCSHAAVCTLHLLPLLVPMATPAMCPGEA